MIITDVAQQRHNKKRYSVFIDNTFAFGLDEIDILYYKIKIDNEITEERYNYILNNVVLAKCRDKAVKLLSYSAKSEKELYNRLKQEDFTDDIIIRVIELLKKYGYIDDEAYAKNFARDKFNINSYGTKKISYELKLKGISSEIIEKIISELDFDETEKAKSLLLSKLKGNINPDFKTKQKMYNFLLRKGYSYDTVNECFSALEKE